MKRALILAATAVFLFAGAGAHAAPPQTLPSLPNADAGAAPAAPSPQQGGDARRGLVTVEKEGRQVGVGTVLANDGRVITALSALGTSEQVDIRYADNHVVHAKVGHKDKSWDLALLVPLTGKWTEGLVASEADPSGTDVRAFLGAGRAAPSVARVKGKVDAQAKEGGSTLVNALDVDVRGATPTAGAPLVDGNNSVVGILVKACKASANAPVLTSPPTRDASAGPACTTAIFGAPVGAIRSFLVRTPATAVAPAPWLGIVGAPDTAGTTRGVRVMAVAPGSPADKSGLKTHADRAQAHMVVAVDGRPVDTPEKLASEIGKHAVGDTVKLLILDGEKLREVQVVLRAAPQ